MKIGKVISIRTLNRKLHELSLFYCRLMKERRDLLLLIISDKDKEIDRLKTIIAQTSQDADNFIGEDK